MIERSLAGGEAELIRAGLGQHLAVISDQSTFDALGLRVERALAKIASTHGIVLDAPMPTSPPPTRCRRARPPRMP